MITDKINVLNSVTADYIRNLALKNYNYFISKSDKYLYYEDNILKLSNQGKEFYIDFNNNDILNRINPKIKKCNIIQAIEGRCKDKLKVLDTTAGLGTDTFTLAARGHKLIAIEKDPYIFLLLKDALSRTKQIDYLQTIVENINLLNDDSVHYILNINDHYDCIYVDPMFPPRKKSAKVKQNMQLLHQIAFNDEQANNKLLENIFRTKKTKKIIVKRPINSNFLCDKKPSSQLKGKTNRFDIYTL